MHGVDRHRLLVDEAGGHQTDNAARSGARGTAASSGEGIVIGGTPLEGPLTGLVRLDGTTESATWTLLERVSQLLPDVTGVRPSLAAEQVTKFAQVAKDAAHKA